MILVVTDIEKDYGPGVYRLSLDEFAMKAYHPFIAASTWDKVYIKLCEATPRGIIRQVVGLNEVIPIIAEEDMMRPRVLQLLCEVFPGMSGKLRSTYMECDGSYAELVKGLTEGYGYG